MADERRPIDELLAEVHAHIPRLVPHDALAAQRAGAVIVDIREGFDRWAEGSVPGAVTATRNTLEWRTDPTAEVSHPVLSDPARDLVIMCNDGYASGLAVDVLHRLGRTNVFDLVGGYRAWRSAGLPTDHEPDGCGSLGPDELATLVRLVREVRANGADERWHPAEPRR